jgi:NAD(P)-dependent dehydrogenase (short-subunit alcohol dehydrogenase family)
MNPLRGKTVLVTGASRGLGRHMSVRLAREGMNVVLAARSDADLHAVGAEVEAAGGMPMIYRLDVRDRRAFEACLEAVQDRFGGLDVLVLNAGLSPIKPFAEWTPEEIDEVLDTNLRAVVHGAHAALPLLLKRRGHLVVVASDVGRKPAPNLTPYAAAKHGVVGFAASLLREVKAHGVRVTTLLPGIIDTYFGGGAEGGRDEAWAMRPAAVADALAWVLAQPEGLVLDEVTLHPLGQDF